MSIAIQYGPGQRQTDTNISLLAWIAATIRASIRLFAQACAAREVRTMARGRRAYSWLRLSGQAAILHDESPDCPGNLDSYAAYHPQLTQRATIKPLLQDALRKTPAGSIIDAGCGEGATVAAIMAQRQDLSAIGVDLSLHRAAIARSRGNLAIVGDVQALPLRGGSAALVICRHVVEHVDSDVELIRELRRVLEPDGYLYLETPLRLTGAWYFYRSEGSWCLDPTHKREYRCIEEVTRLLETNGFLPLEVRTEPISYPLTHMVRRLLHLLPRARSPKADLSEPRVRLPIPRYRELQVLAKSV